ncbi:MAG: hypothetical protein VX278_04690 [Myxococcota bacterium]|nr:hypothetical protein [Myxococcota bacterium]
MILLLSCATSTVYDSGFSAISDWPDTGTRWETPFSLVYDGQLLHNGQTIEVESAPAGIDHPTDFPFQLRSLQEERLDFIGEWLSQEPFLWTSSPPTTLESEAAHSFNLRFNPLSCSEAADYHATLSVPGHDFSIEIHVSCPAPLRTVLMGDNGFSLVSDDYGASFFSMQSEGLAPPLRAQSIAWGSDIFLRVFAKGNTGDAPGLYQYSVDGLQWENTESTAEFAASDCSYGLGRFVCARTDTLSWTSDGKTMHHEEALGDFKLNQILFRNGQFIAVGRGARRVRSFDGQNWEDESFGTDSDTYHSLVQSEDKIIAAGGINRYYISYSEDDGESWIDVPYGGCQGNYIQSLVYHNGLFLAQGASSCHHNMHRSADGIVWEPIVELQPFDRYELLGAINGYFIAQSQVGESHHIFRSTDGYTWEDVFTIPNDKTIRHMAAQEWSP